MGQHANNLRKCKLLFWESRKFTLEKCRFCLVLGRYGMAVTNFSTVALLSDPFQLGLPAVNRLYDPLLFQSCCKWGDGHCFGYDHPSYDGLVHFFYLYFTLIGEYYGSVLFKILYGKKNSAGNSTDHARPFLFMDESVNVYSK